MSWEYEAPSTYKFTNTVGSDVFELTVDSIGGGQYNVSLTKNLSAQGSTITVPSLAFLKDMFATVATEL